MRGIWTKTFIAMNTIYFLMFIIFAMLISTLPQYTVSVLQSESHQVGWILGIFSLFVLISRVPCVWLLNRFGSDRVLRVSLLCMLCTVLLYFVTEQIAVLLAVRALHGFLFGIVTTVLAANIAETIPPGLKGKGIGYFGMFQSLAMALGPQLGQRLMQHSVAWLFGFIAFLAFSAILIHTGMNRIVGGNQQEKKMGDSVVSGSAPEQSMTTITSKSWIEKSALPASVTMLCLAIVYGSIASYLPMMADGRGWSEWVGMFFFCYALGLIVVRPLSGKMIDIGMMHGAVWCGLLFIGIGLLFVNDSKYLASFFLSSLLLGGGFGLGQTALQVHAMSSTQPSRLAAATGTFYMSLDIGYGAGSVGLGSMLLLWDLPHVFESLILCPIAAGILWLVYHWRSRLVTENK